MKSTIKDIAKDTGLSLATISKYLNHKKISEKNRLLIEESIKKYNYQPNSNAQALRSKNSYCICIFTPSLQDYYFGRECDFIIKAMHEKGYSTIIRSYSDETDLRESDIAFLQNRHIDGVILFARMAFPPLLITYLNSNQIPFVCMHQKPGLPAAFVEYDHHTAAKAAVQYLLEKNHTRILLLGLESYSTTSKIESFIQAYQAQGLDPAALTITLFPSLEYVEDYTLPNPIPGDPTAVLFMDHFTSLPLIRNFLGTTNANTYSYSLLAFEDDPVFASLIPPVTAISQDAMELGHAAADLLYAQLTKEYGASFAHKTASVKLTERQSVYTISD